MTHTRAYLCLTGDVDNILLTEAEVLGLLDTRGRNWICKPIPINTNDFGPMIEQYSREVVQAQNRLNLSSLEPTQGSIMQLWIQEQTRPTSEDEALSELEEFLSSVTDDDDKTFQDK